jgi:hypothetical protein
MANIYKQFKDLVAGPPLLMGEVAFVGTGDSEGTVTVTLWGGAVVNCRGTATLGEKVFVRDGVIEGPAPNLALTVIEL